MWKKGEKIAFVGPFDKIKTTLFQIVAGEMQADEGALKWGASTSKAYYPKDNTKYFETELNILDWLRQYTDSDDVQFIRGFLGRMLFSGDEQDKKVNVLSGGEKVRCMLSRMMLTEANCLIMDEPTNHLDLESITALNKGMKAFKGTLLFSSHDHQLVQTVADRIIEITPYGCIDKQGMSFDEFLSNNEITERRHALYTKNEQSVKPS